MKREIINLLVFFGIIIFAGLSSGLFGWKMDVEVLRRQNKKMFAFLFVLVFLNVILLTVILAIGGMK